MRIRTFSLIIPSLVLVAACASTASSPSAAAPSVAAPSVAPTVAPSASAPASVAPSEPASVDPGTAFRDETLQPVLDEISTALTRWADAAAAAAAPDADDTDRIALGSAAFRVRVALESGTALLDAAEVPDCATSARDEAKTYIEGLTSSSEDLLGDDSASPDDINAVVQQATEGSAPLLEALSTACA